MENADWQKLISEKKFSAIAEIIHLAPDHIKNDKILAMEVIKTLKKSDTQIEKAYKFVKNMGDVLKNDREVMIQAMKVKSDFFYFASEEIRGDKDFIKNVFNQMKTQKKTHNYQVTFINFATQKIKDDGEFFKELFNSQKDFFLIRYAPDRLLRDTQFMLEVQRKYPGEIVAEKALTFEKEMMIEMISINQENFKAMDKLNHDLYRDADVQMALIKADGKQLSSAHALHDNKEAVLIAFETSTYGFSNISDRLKADFDLALQAVTDNPKNYQYCDLELKLNTTIIEAALKQDGEQIKYMPYSIKNNPEYALMAMEATENGNREYISKELKEIIRSSGEDPKQVLSKMILKDMMESEFTLKDTAANSKAQALLTGIHSQGVKPKSRPPMRAKI